MDCDLEKTKIEIVRDALKDVIDTVRAQDRKASYMMAIVFFLISTFTLTTLKINAIEKLQNFDDFVLFYPIVYFVIAVCFLFYSYNPVSNPTEVLIKEDVEVGKDKFFVFYEKDKDKSAETLAENFINATSDIKGILKILYIEILKLSKIRERKISLIKRASFFIIVAVLTAFAQILSLYNFSFEFFGISLFLVIICFMCKKA
jgi:hypothetical protein